MAFSLVCLYVESALDGCDSQSSPCIIVARCTFAWRVFSSPDERQLEKFIIHPGTETIYVSAVNCLYQLSDNLELQHQHETGPKRTDGSCFPPAWEATIGPTSLCSAIQG